MEFDPDAYLSSITPKKGSIDAALAAENITGAKADFVRSIYQQESGSGKNTKTSNAGAVGGMQIIPATFNRMADKGWSIDNPEQNLRAGIRYASLVHDKAGGDAALAGAGYYGGEGAIAKARNGVAVSDPRNPNAPNTLQYGQQVAARIPQAQAPSIPSVDAKFDPDAYLASKQKITAPAKTSFMDDVQQGVGNLAAGAVRGAGSIGSSILEGANYVANTPALQGTVIGQVARLAPQARPRAEIDAGLQSMGAQPNSLLYKGGKIAGEIAGTAGVGGAIAKGAAAVAPTQNALIQSIASGGLDVAGKTGLSGLATRAAGGAITGGASAALVNPEDAAMGAAVGGAFPIVARPLALGAQKLGSAFKGGDIAPEVGALYKRATDLGIDIPADRIGNSKPMNALASALNYVPLSGRAATESTMNSQLNQALSRTFGQDSSNVTMALRKAETDLGAKFDTVLKSNTVTVDKQFASDIQSIYKTAEQELGTDALRPISSQIREIMDKSASGAIDGQAAYNIKKTLDRLGRGSGNEAYHARELKSALMGALDRSLGPTEAAAFAETRKQYGNMMSLQNLAKNGAEGEVSVARLANMKNINNPDMQELADIAAQFVRPREGAHGAAQRAAAGGITFGLGGAPALAAGAVSGRGANMLLNSNFAKNFVMGQSAGANRLADLVRVGSKAAPVLISQ